MHTDLKVGMYWGDMGVDYWDGATWKQETEKHEVGFCIFIQTESCLFVFTDSFLLDHNPFICVMHGVLLFCPHLKR